MEDVVRWRHQGVMAQLLQRAYRVARYVGGCPGCNAWANWPCECSVYCHRWLDQGMEGHKLSKDMAPFGVQQTYDARHSSLVFDAEARQFQDRRADGRPPWHARNRRHALLILRQHTRR